MWWLLALGALAAAGILSKHRHLKRWKTWENAVEACGFKVERRSSPGTKNQMFEVRAGSATVRIEDRGGQTVVFVPGRPGLSGVSISRGYRPPEGRELETGDDLFDSTFFVEGPEQLVRGVLDAETRRLLLGLSFNDRLETSRSEIRVETSDENLQSVLPLVVAIGRRFARRAEAQLLSENARQDPEAGVRLQNLLLLIREHPGKSPTLMALRKACSDPAPEVRLQAAMALGRSDVLVELAESPADDAVSAEAVSGLERELPFERMRAILDQALDRRLVRTACACLEALGRRGDPAAVGVLAEVMAREGGETAAAAAVALGATGSPAAEPPLLLALQREGIRAAAVDALARTGTAAAVLPLEEAAGRSPDDRELRRATRQAIAEIQARLEGASPGQLSLAGTEAGQLSLAPADAGQLSLAEAEAGQLSLPPEEPEQSPKAREEAAARPA